MKVIFDKDIKTDSWQKLYALAKFKTPFHSIAFYNLINSIPNFSASVIALENENSLESLCIITFQQEKGIKSFFSKRAIIYGGFLELCPNSSNISILLQNIVSAFKQRTIYFEVRNYIDHSIHIDLLTSTKWLYLPYLNITLLVKGKTLDSLLADMKYNRRREIKLSISQNVQYRECLSLHELQCLYNILNELYTNRVKLPLPVIDFFINLWQSSIGKVFVVIHEEKIIGGSFCVYEPNVAIYTWYYCGIREYKRNIFPTHLAVLAALEFALDNDLVYLDFMGAGQKTEAYGVRKYKQEFGGNTNEYGRFLFINKPILYAAGKQFLKIKKRLLYGNHH